MIVAFYCFLNVSYSFPVTFLVYGFLVGFSFLYFTFLLLSFLHIYWVVFKIEKYYNIAVIIIDYIYTHSYFEQVF